LGIDFTYGTAYPKQGTHGIKKNNLG
jgi:hypothetical protein